MDAMVRRTSRTRDGFSICDEIRKVEVDAKAAAKGAKRVTGDGPSFAAALTKLQYSASAVTPITR